MNPEDVKHASAALTAALLLTSCASAPPPPDHIGIWHAPGYNLIIEIEPAGVTLIERTSMSCFASGEEDNLKALFEEDLNVTLSHPDRLDIRLVTAQTGYRLDRISEARRDRLCPETIVGEVADPELNFEIFWTTFDDNYAYFDLRGVDWQATYDRFRGQVDQETTRDELIAIFTAMVAPLRDGHVLLSAEGEEEVDIFELEIERRLAAECAREAPPCDDPEGYLQDQAKRFKSVLTDVYLTEGYETAFDRRLLWGRLSPDVGYLYFGSAGGYDDDEVSTRDVERLQPVLDRVFEDFAGQTHLVVDLRGNQGGDDYVALALADRIADEQRLVFTKAAFEDGGLTPPQPAFTRPSARPGHGGGEVIVLTSSITASAAEILTLAFRAMPHATLIGEPTAGEFSDIHLRSLPNGVVFGLSNEVYLAGDGESFEARGVTPDIAMPFLPLDDRKRGRDSMIDRALSMLTMSP